MSKLLVVLLSLVISQHAMAFDKQAGGGNVVSSTPVKVKTTTPAKSTPTPIPATNAIVNTNSDGDGDAEYYADKAKAKAKPAEFPAVKKLDSVSQTSEEQKAKAGKKAEADQLKYATNERKSSEKKKETETLAFLKSNAGCGRSSQAGISTTGNANAFNQIKANYSEENAPSSVKKLIQENVDSCDRKIGVGKYYKDPAAAASAKATKKSIAPVESQAKPVTEPETSGDDPDKKVGDFFSKLGSDIKNNGVKEKICSPGETQMHANGC